MFCGSALLKPKNTKLSVQLLFKFFRRQTWNNWPLASACWHIMFVGQQHRCWDALTGSRKSPPGLVMQKTTRNVKATCSLWFTTTETDNTRLVAKPSCTCGMTSMKCMCLYTFGHRGHKSRAVRVGRRSRGRKKRGGGSRGWSYPGWAYCWSLQSTFFDRRNERDVWQRKCTLEIQKTLSKCSRCEESARSVGQQAPDQRGPTLDLFFPWAPEEIAKTSWWVEAG